MHFSDETLRELRNGYQTVKAKFEALFIRYVASHFADAKAREYATQGFSRRLQIMVRCIDRVFEILPPDRTEAPTRDQLSDAAINIQAFVINVFGSIDNLAWVWVCEKGLTRDNGRPIPNTLVGLGAKNELVRASFSAKFQVYLKGLDAWFDYLENFRHALAHRIPLYIPPYVVTKDKEAAHRELEDRMTDAIKRRNYADYERLSVEQMKLGMFSPLILHSFEEKAKPVVFHAQLLADFNTVEALGWKMLDELAR
jgi:hypothetical protein